MTTNTATDTTNVIPMMRTGTTPSVTPEKGAIHVFSGENGENDRFGKVSDTRFDEKESNFSSNDDCEKPVSIAKKLEQVFEVLEAKHAERTRQNRQLLGDILCHQDVANQLREYVRENDARNRLSRYVQGVLAMLEKFDAGAAVNVVDLAESVSSEELPKTFLRDFVKPVIEKLGILLKQENGTFMWVGMSELQAMHHALYAPEPAINVQSEQTDVQSTCNQGAMDVQSPAIGLRLLGNRLAVNPLARVRHWQRERAMQAALADPWKKVTASGAVEVIHNPYDPKATGPRTEKEKELIRKAAIVEAEAQLKFKIAAAGDKQRMQEIQRASLDADAQAQAIINESKIKLAQMQQERLMRSARLATYKPALLVAGLAAAVLFIVANNNGAGLGNNNDYPVELANMPLPAVGNGE